MIFNIVSISYIISKIWDILYKYIGQEEAEVLLLSLYYFLSRLSLIKYRFLCQTLFFFTLTLVSIIEILYFILYHINLPISQQVVLEMFRLPTSGIRAVLPFNIYFNCSAYMIYELLLTSI